jgi:hypothetical protein
MVSPIEMTDAMLAYSSVDDPIGVVNYYAFGTIFCTDGITRTSGKKFVVGDSIFTTVTSGTVPFTVVISNNAQTFANNIATALNRDIGSLITATVSPGGLPNYDVSVASKIPGTEGNSISFYNSSPAVEGVTFSTGGYLHSGVDEVPGNLEWRSYVSYLIPNHDIVVVTANNHHRYENIYGGGVNFNNPPATSPQYWLDLGATNRWLMFDNTVTSQTIYPNEIEVTLTPGEEFDSVIILNSNATKIHIVETNGGTYDEYIYVEEKLLADPSQFEILTSTEGTNILLSSSMSSSSEINGNYAKLDLPLGYPGASVTITITNENGNATCGFLILGRKSYIGVTQYGIEVSILDYSVKEVDEWGNYFITERAYAKLITFPVFLPTSTHDEVKILLAQYRAIPVVWVGHIDYSVLISYGFVKEWEMVVGTRFTKLLLEIEGLI